MNTSPIIRVKRSLVPGKVPTVEQLGLGEIAINHYDAKVFIRQDTLGVGIGTTVVQLGIQGVQGTQGVQGEQGVQGVQGVQGLTGAGSQGTQGTQGVQGFSFSKQETSFIATEGQTTFTVNYVVGYVDVYLNGVRLSDDEYTATNGTSIVLTVGASEEDIVDVISFESAGPQGIQGIQGHNGPQGIQGIQGHQGTTGIQGTQGVQGFSFSKQETNFIATSGQTTFTVNYVVGYVDVYLNGIRLSDDEYTATNGTSIVLDDGANDQDAVDVISFESAGPQGIQGIQGHNGPQGIQGPQGTQGVQGIQGVQGFSFSRQETNFIATSGQTTFTVNYVVGYVDVYLNGARLNDDEYTATNGTSIVLDVGANDQDSIDVISFESAGPQGTQGLTGAGAQGIQGLQGTDGIQGTQGVQGTAGYIGADGAQGSQGVQGTQGIQGVQGTSGANYDKSTVVYTATDGQTTFAATYTVGFVDVYLNGIRLSPSQYTASNGTSVILTTGASLGDIIELVTYNGGTLGAQGFAGVSYDKAVTVYTATDSQTTFAVTYTVGFVDVYLNGIRLSPSQYTASNGTSVILSAGASLGDILELVAYTGGNLGAQGIQGPQGTTGIQGAEGTQGIQGVQGNNNGGVTVIDDVSTNATRFIVFEDVTSGISTNVGVSSTKFTFNPSTGNVGIGTTNPTTKLDIVGNANITGILTAATSVVVGSAVTINSSGVITVGIVTASAFVDDGTNLLTEINTKTSTGKAIAMAMIFG